MFLINNMLTRLFCHYISRSFATGRLRFPGDIWNRVLVCAGHPFSSNDFPHLVRSHQKEKIWDKRKREASSGREDWSRWNRKTEEPIKWWTGPLKGTKVKISIRQPFEMICNVRGCPEMSEDVETIGDGHNRLLLLLVVAQCVDLLTVSSNDSQRQLTSGG